jgi:hypothetical protein
VVGLLVFAGEGGGVQRHHAVGLAAQHFDGSGATSGRRARIEQALKIGLALGKAVHYFALADFGDVAGLAGQA